MISTEISFVTGVFAFLHFFVLTSVLNRADKHRYSLKKTQLPVEQSIYSELLNICMHCFSG